MLYAIVAVIALIIDQAVKYWTTANIVLNEGTRKLIPGLIHMTNIHNTGAAFSILEGARWFFVILCLAFVALIIYVLVKDIINTPLARWMAVMVMAGAVGNCIDRVICGYVVDMFEFEFMTFPIFNVADIYITVCGILFCLFVLFEKPKTAEQTEAKTQRKSFSLPKRQKLVIPDFPKREKVETEAPKVDPNDPFAEWERRAAAKVEAEPQVAEEVKPSSGAALKAEAEEFVRAQTQPEPEFVEVKAQPVKTVEVPVYQQPVQPKPEAPKAEPAKSAESVQAELPKAVDEFDFNLDDILAEFGDL